MTPAPRPPRPPKVAVLNNEIFPYRIQLFRELGDSPAIRLLVLYSTKYGEGRDWKVNPALLDYPHRILPGLTIRLPKKMYSEKRTIYLNPTLFWELVRFRPDVLVGYEYSVPSMTAFLFARIFHKPFLLWTDCTPRTDLHLTRGQRWARAFLIPRADLCLGTNAKSCENLIASGAAPERVLEVPQMHEAHHFGVRASASGRKSDPAHPVVLYVGALTERKGIPFLFQAFEAAAKMHSSARLRIVGDGRLRPQLEETAARLSIRDRVDFAGFVNYDRIHEEYTRADIFVLPTLEDAFGVVVVEALSAGVPVICSPFAGAADYLRDGENAFLVDPQDTRLLGDRIIRLLGDPALRRTFSEKGRALSLLFDAPAVAKIFLSGIEQALGCPPNRTSPESPRFRS